MNIEVKYKNKNGNILDLNYEMSKLAFIKHFAIAGQKYAPHPRKILRALGMLLHYQDYLQRGSFNNNKFSEPPINISDPTEKGQFSNLAGKAIADFLSKRIDNSSFTINYEAAMRIKGIPLSVNGKQVRRPDLLAFNQKSEETFAIEVKGYTGGAGNMDKHKKQSKTGGIDVDFTVASVSYNLYKKVKCKYFDPYNDNIPFDKELFKNLTKEYYSGFSEFLDYSSYKEIEYQKEKFYEVDLFYPPYFDEYFLKDEKPFRYFMEEIFHFYRPILILPSNIKEFAKNGLSEDISPFLFESKIKKDIEEQDNKVYIDNDRIGLKIRRNEW